MMNVNFDDSLRRDLETSYRSRLSPSGRRIYQGSFYLSLVRQWVEYELTCPRCGAIGLRGREQELDGFRDCVNYVCQACGREFYLVSTFTQQRCVARSNIYQALRLRIEAGTMPDLICLRYDRDELCVIDLYVVSGHWLRTDYLDSGFCSWEQEDGRDIWCTIAVGNLNEDMGGGVIVDVIHDGEQHDAHEVARALRAADTLADA